MNTKKALLICLFAAVSLPVFADSDGTHDSHVGGPETTPMQGMMMGGGKEGMPMMKMMQERHAMMQAHMTKMEGHMENIEALLKQLVELQKK